MSLKKTGHYISEILILLWGKCDYLRLYPAGLKGAEFAFSPVDISPTKAL